MSAASSPVKILVTGSSNGKIRELFVAVSKIVAKYGPFDLLLCVGDLFDEANSTSVESLFAGEVTVPLMTYFMHGQRELPETVRKRVEENNGEVCPNLHYLGQQGSITTVQGVKISFVSGIVQSSDVKLPTDNVDILLTHEWPKSISRLSSQPVAQNFEGSKHVADLVMRVRPRYHFAAAEEWFYKREPYKNPSPRETADPADGGGSDVQESTHATWFVGLASVGKTSKDQKWYYGFNLVPFSQTQDASMIGVPAEATDCPFLARENKQGRKREHVFNQGGNYFYAGGESVSEHPPKRGRRDGQDQPPPGYVCNICKEAGHFIRECPQRTRKARSDGPPADYVCKACNEKGHFISDCPKRVEKQQKAEPCWFCLSNPKTATQLLLSIGSEVYLSMARGSLIDPSNPRIALVPGSGHVLLVSIAHHWSFTNEDMPLETQVNVTAELEKYKSGLKQMFERYKTTPVIFEFSRPSPRQHAHMQIVPVPLEHDTNSIRAAFEREAEADGFKFSVFIPPMTMPRGYFRVDLPDGTVLVHKIGPQTRFDMQFGRKVLANLLGCPERIDWKACTVDVDTERVDTNKFRDAFKEFDATQ